MFEGKNSQQPQPVDTVCSVTAAEGAGNSGTMQHLWKFSIYFSGPGLQADSLNLPTYETVGWW